LTFNCITILLQGNYTADTAISIRRLRALAPDLRIVLSCWESNRADVIAAVYPDIVTVFTEDPGAPAISGFKVDNIRRQIVSSRVGLESVETPWVVKIRSDISLDPYCIKEVLDLCVPLRSEKLTLFSHKVVATSLTTLDSRRSDLYFHVCDWVYIGAIDDVRAIFSVALPEDDFFAFFQSAKPTPEICSRYRSETYLIFHLVHKKLGTSYPFSGYRDDTLVGLSHDVMKTNFVIVNPWNLGLHSSKYKNLFLWLRPDRYSEVTCGGFLLKIGLRRAVVAIVLDFASRSASVITAALKSAYRRAHAWR
jgi:hypothetical protein